MHYCLHSGMDLKQGEVNTKIGLYVAHFYLLLTTSLNNKYPHNSGQREKLSEGDIDALNKLYPHMNTRVDSDPSEPDTPIETEMSELDISRTMGAKTKIIVDKRVTIKLQFEI